MGCSGSQSASPAPTPPSPAVYVLTVATANPAGGVAIGATPSDIHGLSSGSSPLSLSYDSGTSVTLTAPATAGGNNFGSWTGCTQTSGQSCTVTMPSSTTVTANYIAPTLYTLTVATTNPVSGVVISATPSDSHGLSSGSSPLSLSYASGTSVTLTAPATASGNNFASWMGCASTSGQSCTVTMSANTTVTANYSSPILFALTVATSNPASGVGISASPADFNGVSSGASPFTLNYVPGTSVTLAAPATAGGNNFSAWTGCSATSGQNCTIAVSGKTTVTAAYTAPISVSISPSSPSAVIGGSVQFSASVLGTSNTGVTWSVSAPGSTLSAGTISATGLYQTPYPAPATVAVTATSLANSSVKASVTATLSAPAAAAGPALSVDTSAVTHTIDPLIYGMNEYGMSTSLQSLVKLPADRWGGDLTTRYNYQLDVSNSANDYYFENNINSNTAYPGVSDFNTQVERDHQYGSKTVATMPLIGYTTKRVSACSFSVKKYGAQKATDPYNPDCGSGVKTDGTNITGNDPTNTSTVINETFVGGWVSYLANKFGTAANGGVAIYQLDNEPEFWSGVHRDVHPASLSYDELTNKGLSYAQAIKTADPTALVSGPVISNWDNYFYSWVDLTSGWATSPCFCYNGNPVDRVAHGSVPLIAYYLQQFKAAEASGGTRLLDYVDIHTYFAAANAAFNPAGDTALQAARLNSTRVFWDPTYTDPAYTDPDNHTSSAPPFAPQIVPFLKNLVAANYPGTKTAVTEYNWGGQESINGAVAQVDILGIFGSQGLDMAMLWGPPDPVAQLPGLLAFQIFQSYDGAGGAFGDGSLAATSADQSKLSIYAAKRTADGAVTVLVLNETFGDLSSTVTLSTTDTAAQAYRLSNAAPGAITHLADTTVTPTGSGAATVSATFPAQSITLLVLK
jgi:hypothetical protein